MSNPEDDEPLEKFSKPVERNEIDDIRKFTFFRQIHLNCRKFHSFLLEDFLNDTSTASRGGDLDNQSSNQEKSDTEDLNDDAGDIVANGHGHAEHVPDPEEDNSGTICPYSCDQCKLKFDDLEDFEDHLDADTCFRCSCGKPHRTNIARLEHLEESSECRPHNY